MSEDNPNSTYWCPVCECDVSLRDTLRHLKKHRDNGEIKRSMEDDVYGLQYLAEDVLHEHKLLSARHWKAIKARRREDHRQLNERNRSKRVRKPGTTFVSGGLPSLGKRR